jgi:hypothetical protein
MELRRRDAIFNSAGGSAFTKSVRPSLFASLAICARVELGLKTHTQNTDATIAK